MLLGRLVLVWAGVERSLGHVVRYLYHAMDGDTIDPEYPRALKRQIQFVRTCANKMDWERRLSDRALELMDETTRLGEERHWCVHGFAHNVLDRTNDDVIRFIRPRLKEPHILDQREYSPEQVNELTAECMVLDGNLSLFVGFWLGAIPEDQRNEFLRKLGVQGP